MLCSVYAVGATVTVWASWDSGASWDALVQLEPSLHTPFSLHTAYSALLQLSETTALVVWEVSACTAPTTVAGLARPEYGS
eukprot:COSAG01_NODE_8907_length_2620_cov_1.702102_2_plen_81_part_00